MTYRNIYKSNWNLLPGGAMSIAWYINFSWGSKLGVAEYAQWFINVNNSQLHDLAKLDPLSLFKDKVTWVSLTISHEEQRQKYSLEKFGEISFIIKAIEAKVKYFWPFLPYDLDLCSYVNIAWYINFSWGSTLWKQSMLNDL